MDLIKGLSKVLRGFQSRKYLSFDKLAGEDLRNLVDVIKKTDGKAIFIVHYYPQDRTDTKYEKILERIIKKNTKLPVFLLVGEIKQANYMVALNSAALFIIVKTPLYDPTPLYKDIIEEGCVSYIHGNVKTFQCWDRFTQFLLEIGIKKIFIGGEFASHKELLPPQTIKKLKMHKSDKEYRVSGCVTYARQRIIEHSDGKIEVIPLIRAIYWSNG